MSALHDIQTIILKLVNVKSKGELIQVNKILSSQRILMSLIRAVSPSSIYGVLKSNDKNLIEAFMFYCRMLQSIMEQNKLIAQQISQQREKIRQLTGNRSSGIFNKQTNVEHYQIFNPNEYPFNKELKNYSKTLKSIIPTYTLAAHLERLISLNHPNIVQIERVAKSTTKSSLEKGAQSYYSLYYEVVPHSLRKLAQSSMAEAGFLPIPTAEELCEKIADVSEYLMKKDIWFKVRLEDIGITEEGQIKVYVPPLQIVNSENNRGHKKEVMTNLDKIVGWWSSVRNSRASCVREKQDGPFSNSLGFENEVKQISRQKITTSFIEKCRRDSGEEKPRQRPGSPNKIRTLEQELMQIKEIMNQKLKQHHMKDPKQHNHFQKVKKELTNPRQSKEEPSKESNQQSILQNINCINIYNNHLPAPSKEGPISLKKAINLQAQQMFSLTIDLKLNEVKGIETAEIKPQTKNKLLHLNNFPEDFHPLEDEDNLSVDTYDMDLGEQFLQIPAVVVDPFRRSLKAPKRQNLQLQVDSEAVDEKAGNNQVFAPKKVTESAGPRQFQNFILQHIKPQFLAKKSNIYEDPDEYESEMSNSEHKQLPACFKELTEAGKSAASYNEKSSSAKKSKQNEVQHFGKNKCRQEPQPLKKSQDPSRNRWESSNAEMNIPSGQKVIKNQRSEALISSKIHQQQMSDRIKAVLEKTKNALALLSKAKGAKIPIRMS